MPGRPTAIIAHTVKGKGVSFMENKLEWHYRSPSDEQLVAALAEIGA
jgi:transketolase